MGNGTKKAKVRESRLPHTLAEAILARNMDSCFVPIPSTMRGPANLTGSRIRTGDGG